MGWDLKSTADAAINLVPNVATAPQDVSLQQAAGWVFGAILAFGVLAAVWRLVPRVLTVLEETVFSNWRLALLGATAVALSLASGYTTWDGMKNFTGESMLSLLITFGIQGVMLIIAWLIGESFATGMSQTQSKRGGAWDLVATGLFGILVFTAVGIWAGQAISSDSDPSNVFNSSLAETIQNYATFGAVGALILAFVFALAKSDLGVSYIQSTRVIIQNSVLWVMFLACMATSVFFSFDSLFTAIFPKEERVRAAELRAQNQVAGVVADIGATIEDRRISAAQDLFSSEGWVSYDTQLSSLAAKAKESEGEVEKYFHDQAEARNQAIAEQQERVTSAQSGQAGLAAKKISLTDELSRLKGERPTLAAEYAEKKNALDERAKEIDAKRVEAMAEAKGVEGTLKTGKGPIWRERMAELGKLRDYYKVGEERVKDAKKRLDAVQTRIAKIERELAQVDGDLAKLKGEEETATQRIGMTQAAVSVEDGDVLDPARMLPAFEKARVNFRQEPTAERLTDVQKVCSQILGAMLTATPATKNKVKGLDCDPKDAVEAASVLFALNTGSAAFTANCAGGDKLTAHRSADALFGFSRRCLADSGLPSKETDTLRTKINFMELNRDDKAHRFVVTWNAFQDGNRLAYLALAIAISIDALVFMSGLFGANVVRSPLSDVPNYKARSATQLEATINAALGAHQYETASLVLGCLKPITNTDGFSALADLSEVHPGVANRVRMVLTAGADIGAVQTVPGPGEQYRVRSELREYLSSVADRHLKSDSAIVQLAKLEQLLREALRPYTHEHADMTLNHFEPVSTKEGYTSMVTIGSIDNAYEARVVRRVVNAGAASESIATDSQIPDRYYIRPDVYRALLLIRANDPPSPEFAAAYGPLDGGDAAGAIAGGRLDAAVPPLPDRPERPQITQRAPEPQAQQDSDDPNESDNFVDELLEHIADEIGDIQTLTLQRYIRVGRNLDISEIRDTLRDILRMNEMMGQSVGSADRAIREGIDRARVRFAGKRALNETQNRLLQDVSNSIIRLRPVILLGENGAYRNILNDMEDALLQDDGAGTLYRQDARLLPYLKKHIQELKDADLDTRAGWDDVLSSLKSFNKWMAAHASKSRRPANRA